MKCDVQEKTFRKNADATTTPTCRAVVLILIILYWLFAIGTFGDLANWFNG